jgi:hypothetical protein
MIPLEAAQAAVVARALAPLKQLTQRLPDVPRRNRTPVAPDAPHVEPQPMEVRDLQVAKLAVETGRLAARIDTRFRAAL